MTEYTTQAELEAAQTALDAAGVQYDVRYVLDVENDTEPDSTAPVGDEILQQHSALAVAKALSRHPKRWVTVSELNEQSDLASGTVAGRLSELANTDVLDSRKRVTEPYSPTEYRLSEWYRREFAEENVNAEAQA